MASLLLDDGEGLTIRFPEDSESAVVTDKPIIIKTEEIELEFYASANDYRKLYNHLIQLEHGPEAPGTNLIANAPELLKVCCDLRNHCQYLKHCLGRGEFRLTEEQVEMLNNADEVIDKARTK